MEGKKNTVTHKANPFKSLGTLSLLTLCSRIAGLLREIAKTYFLGVSTLSDAFNLAFSIPNLFRRLTAEGAMQNAFLPSLATADKKQGKMGRLLFVNSFFWWFSLFLLIFVVMFILFTPELMRFVFAAGFQGVALDETVVLTRTMFIYILFISLAAILQAILNFHNIFWISAFTPILLNLSIIICAFLFHNYFENAAMAMAIGVVIGGFLQLAVQLPFVLKLQYFFFRFRSILNQHSKKTLQHFLPGIFGAGIYQLNIIVSNLIATTLITGSITALTISNRLIEFVLGIFIVSISTIILPQLSKLLTSNDLEEAKKMLVQGLKLAAFVIIPVMAGLFITGKNIISILFGHGEFTEQDVFFTYYALQFHILGMIFISWNRVLTAGFYAKKWYKRNVMISFWVFIVNITLSLGLIHFFSYAGIALANSLSQAFQTCLMISICYRFLQIKIFDRTMVVMLLKTLLATAVMCVILYGLTQLLNQYTVHKIIMTILTITLGMLSFMIVCYLLKIQELKLIKQIFLRA